MPVERINKFLEFRDLGLTPSLGIETNQIEECIKEVQMRNIQGVFGNPCFGFYEKDLDFLSRIPSVEQVYFWDVHLKSVEGIYALDCLRYFNLRPKRPAIDFARLPGLELMIWYPVRRDLGIQELTRLREIHIWRYKSKSKGFGELSLPQSLEKVDVNWSNVTSLNGFPVLQNLKEIQFHYCRSLTSLAGLSEAAPNLKKIVVTRCPNLSDCKEISGMDLDHAYVNVRNKELVNMRSDAKTD